MSSGRRLPSHVQAETHNSDSGSSSNDLILLYFSLLGMMTLMLLPYKGSMSHTRLAVLLDAEYIVFIVS